VNGQQITGITPLTDGDEVRFGNTIWRLGKAAAQATAIHSSGAQTVAPPPTTSVAPAGGSERAPSALRQAVTAEAVYGEAPQFDSGPAPRPIFGRSAARQIEATVFSYAVIAATAAGVIYFFAQR
jgi:hypothetical protein